MNTPLILSAISVWARLILSAVHQHGGNKRMAVILAVMACLGVIAQLVTRGFA